MTSSRARKFLALGWLAVLGWGSANAASAPSAPPLAQAPATPQPQEAPRGASGDLLIGRITVDGAAPFDVRFGFDGSQGVKAFVFSTENRPGVATVIGGHGIVPAAAGRSGLTLLFFVHFYIDGAHFLEGQIANDAIADPPGKVNATWHLEFRGEVIADGKGEIADECAVGFHAGTPRYAPRIDLWSKYTSGLPDPKTLPTVDRKDAEPLADADPNPNTHAAGSPRNRYVAVEAAKYYFTEDVRYLARLADYVAAQARRPYHLSEIDGVPFRQAKYPESRFIEGRPEMKPYLTTFGRLALGTAALGAPPQNGWDHEHMNVEELYAAYVLCGSRIARREILLIAEQILTTPYVRDPGHSQHSARAFGWVARMLVRAHQVSGEDRYLDAVRTMMDSVRANGQMEGSYRSFVPQDPRNDHMPTEKFESPFMVAVAASAIALYLQEAPHDEQARELLRFCGDLLIDQGYSSDGGGFYYDYSVESGNKNGDGKAIDGVVLFITSALVEVAMEMSEDQREKYLGPARVVFGKQMENKWASPSAPEPHFYKWLLRAARELR